MQKPILLVILFFGRLPRDFRRILLGSSENGRDPRFRKPSAPEAGKLLKDRREHCFVNEKVLKNIRKNNHTLQFFCLGIGITKVHCIAIASIHSFTRSNNNIRTFIFFRIPILLAFCSAKFANSTVFRMHILLVFSSAKSASSAVFRIPILFVTKIFLQSLPFSEDLADLRCPKEYV